MPPKDLPNHVIERTPEYEEFIEKLRAFHADRGTSFDPEPKVGTTHLDLLRVFKHIVNYGGYDKVSDEKLAWRRMAGELGLYTNNEAATAFALKEKFYKNLAAYEIKTIHGQEPPPKDILEDVTAKGSGLLKRTRENFHRSSKAYGVDSVASGDDGTPARERPATTETPNSSRASRGLREAPPQRVIFQPDTGPSRPTRQASSAHQPPAQSASASPAQGTPGSQHLQHHRGPINQVPSPHQQLTRNTGQVTGGGPYNPNQQQPQVPPFIAAYNPRSTATIPLRPVDTPRNNPQAFSKTKLLARPRPTEAGELPRVPPGSKFLVA